jgi:thiol-disulfide isomerase/thioredoxin
VPTAHAAATRRPRAVRRTAAALSARVAVAVLAGCAPGRAGSETGGVIPVAKRKPAPALTGTGLRGERIDLAALRGAPVVINFWASWCGPCQAEQPELERAAQQTRSKGVHFLGVNIRDGEASARSFLDDHNVSYPSLYDPAMSESVRFGVTPATTPSTFVLDGQGRVAVEIRGQAPPAGELVRIIERVAGEPA